MEKETVAIDRLHALVRKGYKAEIGAVDADGTIRLRHLGRAPDLVLHGDGRLEPLAGRIPRHKRRVEHPEMPAGEASHEVAFLRFLEGVPKASLRDRTRPFRRKYVYLPGALFAIWGVSMMLTALFVAG